MSELEEEKKLVLIAEEREEEMVAFTGGRATVRLARFLKPCLEEVGKVPPLPKSNAYNVSKCPLVVKFRGWNCQRQNNWNEWVDQLRPMHEATWRKTGIYDSIIISTYEFQKDKELLLGLADSWCPETNTFVFSWGEATVTLEDTLILGGFSILGEPVTTPVTGDLLETENQLIEEYKKLVRSKSRNAYQGHWLQRFMGVADHLEHPAFLALWLSRYVLPTKSKRIIDKKLFSAAIHLSQETPIALAPVVLAGIYKELRLMKEQIDVSSLGESLTVWAPVPILQLWAWERFLCLQPTPNSLHPNEPRAARWNKLRSELTIDLVRRSINLPDEFQWRPYSSRLENWQHPLYDKQHCEWVTVNPKMKSEVLSFLRCVMPCELVGIDCTEQYAPHRVGMQFGMDQDIPGAFTQAQTNTEIAWRTHDKPIQNISFYIPPRLFESDVTTRYFQWWKQSSSIKQADMKNISIRQLSSSSSSVSSESERFASPPGFACKRMSEDRCPNDENKMILSEWLKRQKDYCPVNHKFACKRRSEDRSPNDEDKMTLSQWLKREKDYSPVNRKPASPGKYISGVQVQSGSSITKNKTTRKEQMRNDLPSKAPMEIGDIVEEGKELEINDSCEFLVDLQMRVNKLENAVKWLKSKSKTSHWKLTAET